MGVSREDSLVSISNTETSEAVKIKRFRNFLKKPVISHDWSLDFDVFLCEKLNRLTIFSFDFEGKNYFAMIARGKIMELTARSRAEVTDVGIFCSLKKIHSFPEVALS